MSNDNTNDSNNDMLYDTLYEMDDTIKHPLDEDDEEDISTAEDIDDDAEEEEDSTSEDEIPDEPSHNGERIIQQILKVMPTYFSLKAKLSGSSVNSPLAKSMQYKSPLIHTSPSPLLTETTKITISSIPLLGILTLNRPDLLGRLIKHIDYPVEHCVILFQQGYLPSGPYLRDFVENQYIQKFSFVFSSHNMGVSRGWNYIMSAFPSVYWLIVGDDNYYGKGSLQTIATTMAQPNSTDNVFYYMTKKETLDPTISVFGTGSNVLIEENHGFHSFVITPKSIETVGQFDENIYPAYFEDNDYKNRLKLSGQSVSVIPNIHLHTGDSSKKESCTLNSMNPQQRHKMEICISRNRYYYYSKWGGTSPDFPVYTKPFANESKTIQSIDRHNHYSENQQIITGNTEYPKIRTVELSRETLERFDWKYYINTHRDLSRFNEVEALRHWMEWGVYEKRTGYKVI